MWNIYLVRFTYFLLLTDVVRCKPDYLFSYEAGGWLKLHTTPAIWEEAFLRCHDEGAVLASPLNKKLANALHLQMAQFSGTGHLYLGTHDLYSKGDYVSVEGVPLSDMEITCGSHSNGADTGDCLTLSADGHVHYSSCKDALPFICYKKLDNPTMNECGTFDDDYHLNQSTGSCYKFHHDKQTWSRAYRICAAEGGHLVILNDDVEAGVVNDLLPPHTEKSSPWEETYHIGLVAWGKDRIWITIHGESIEDVYNKWDPGQPDNWQGHQDRGSLLWTGKLDDVNVGAKLMFVCEKSPKSKQFEDVSPDVCTVNLMKLCDACTIKL